MKANLVARLVILLVTLAAPSLTWAQTTGPGTAVSLNGTNGYIRVPDGVWFTNNFTVEGWVYARSYNNWSRFFDFGNGEYFQDVYVALSEGTMGIPKMGIFNTGNTTLLTSSQPLPLYQWTHLAVTLNGTTATMYMNGTAVGTQSMVVPANVLRTNNYIGRSVFAADAYANASFDEMRIWNVARTQGEIQANMRRNLVGNETNLLAYWRMDEGTGTSLTDATGHGQTATLFSGSTWTNSAAAIVATAGSAVNFTNNPGQLAIIPHQAALNAYPLTIMCWFKAPPGSIRGGLVNKYSSASVNGYQLWMADGGLKGWYFANGTSNVYNAGTMDAGLVNDGLWHHAAMVVDATGGRLLLDGVLKSSVPWTGTPGAPTTTAPLSLGIYQGDSFWSGQLDEVSLWNTALSSNQIMAARNKSLAGNESGLLSYWRLDEGSGTNIVDATGHGYNGTLQGGTTWVSSGAAIAIPDPGYALNLNGVNQYASATNAAWFTNDFTVEGWVFMRSYNNWSRLIDFGNGENIHNVFLALSAGTGGFPAMGVYTNNNGVPNFAATSQLPLNQWAHLACTLSNTTGTIYINGINVGTGTLNRPANVVRTNNYIGRSNYGGDAYANALFDELRIWNVARTQAQIQQSMKTPLTGREAGLLGYWRFDEGASTNLWDGTGRGRTALLASGTATPTWIQSSAPVSSVANNVTTLSASNLTSTSATLNGSVNPQGLTTSAWFEWGATTNYGNITPAVDPGLGTTNALISSAISGLSAGATYHFRCVATNSTGTNRGGDLSFTLPAAPPAISNQFASSVTPNSAVLNASILVNGADTTVWFQYGTTTNYGSATANTNVSGTNLSAAVINSPINGLSQGVAYHFRAVATNSGGVTYGNDTILIANPFSVVGGTGLANPVDFRPTCAWGDFNNDGLLDVCIANKVYRNNGNNTFSQIAMPGMPNRLTRGMQIWGDYNNDGYVDLLITGSVIQGSPLDQITQLWRNNGNETFTLINGTGLPNMYDDWIAFGDFDNDGWQDLFMMGMDGITPGSGGAHYSCGIWRNDGNGTFTKMSIPGLQAFFQGSVGVGDFDNDGFLDFVVSGYVGSYVSTAQYWHNNGDGTFSQWTIPGLIPMSDAMIAVADYNNDGLLDFIMSGIGSPSATTGATTLWRNNGGTFSQDTSSAFAPIFAGALTWGDFDNDGWPDVFLQGPTTKVSGGSQINPVGQIWKNLGPAGFINLNLNLPGLIYNGGGWGDYNNDGRLDLLYSGFSQSFTAQSTLQRNFTPVTNTPPTAPTGLEVWDYGTEVVFAWNPTSDLETPTAGLSYNIRVGTTPGSCDVVSAQANATNGFLRVPQTGNVQSRTWHYLRNLHSGTYYWSVQAIDSAFAGSAFAPEATFTLTNGLPNPPTAITLAPTSLTSTSVTFNASINAGGAQTFAGFRWGESTFYDNFSPAIDSGSGLTNNVAISFSISGLIPGLTYHYEAAATNLGGFSLGGDVTFTMLPGPPLIYDQVGYSINPPTSAALNASVRSGGGDTLTWFEYGTATNYGSVTASTFFGDTNVFPLPTSAMISNLTLQTLYHFRLVASNAFGVTLGADTTFTTATFFPVTTGLPLPIDLGTDAAWGDFNNDGFLDVAMENLVSRNNGDGTFTQIGIATEPRLSYSTQTWGDLNNDGFLDLLITGSPGNTSQGLPRQTTELWYNNGDGTFGFVGSAGLPNVDYASVAFGDFDNDGRQDILLIGRTGFTFNLEVRPTGGIWRATGGGGFTPMNIPGFPALWEGSVATGDFDNDGYLDFLVMGMDKDNSRYIGLWHNNGDSTFTPTSLPGVPTGYDGFISTVDYNNDGYLDFVVTGLDGNTFTQIWTNNGNGTFTRNTAASIIGINGGTATWGDYDNDGNTDLVMSGAIYGGPAGAIAQVWRNLGDGSFANINSGLPGIMYGATSWGDADNDGRLDILMGGFPGGGRIATVLKNFLSPTNTPPTAPSYLQASVNKFGVVLNWSAGSDAQTPAAGLSYNVRVGSMPGGWNIIGPESNPTNGFRRLPHMGNAFGRHMTILTNLPPGTYYWSVQSVDNAFAGSPFAAESQFTIGGPEPVTLPATAITLNAATINGAVNANNVDTTVWFRWGNTLAYGTNTTPVLVSGTNVSVVALSSNLTGLLPGTTYYYQLVASNSIGMNYSAHLSFTTVSPVPPQINSITTQPNQIVLLQFSGTAGLGYTLQTSTNLVDWSSLTNLTADGNGLFQFNAGSATNIPARFFRLRWP